MHVEFIHRDYLTVASSGSTSLDTKGRALAGLSYIGECQASNMSSERLSQAHGSCGLALTKRSGSDTGDNNIAAVSSVLQSLHEAKVNLGLVCTVRLQLVRCNANL